MLRVIRFAFVILGTLIAVEPILADPPAYRVELMDTGQFEAPSEHLPAGGHLASVAMISPNARYVVVGVVDNGNPGPAVPDRLAILDRVTATALLITDFESPFPFGINNEGAIVVMGQAPGGNSRQMYYWSPSTGAILNAEGGLPRLVSHGAGIGRPRIINNFGQVLIQEDFNVENMLWDPIAGTRTMIEPDAGQPGSVQAVSLNDLGQVVGSVSFPVDQPNEIDIRPFIWDETNGFRLLFDLELVSPDTSPFIVFGRVAIANAINDEGVIAGESWNENGELVGLHWDSEATLPTLLPCPDSAPSQPPRKCAVWMLNDAGEFIGGESSQGEIDSHIIWDGAEPYLLRDLIVEGPNICNILAIADDGTLAGTCGGPFPALVIPIADEPDPDAEAPTVSDVIADPNPAPVGTPVQLTAEIDDSGTGGSALAAAHYTVDGGPATAMSTEDGAFDEPRESVFADLPGFAEPGIYELCVTGTDQAGNVSAPACTLVAVFDASGGFVTGGGWIDAQAGSYAPVPQASGRANFGFVARYKKGAMIPTGSVEFQFHDGDLNFHSLMFDWLIVSGTDNNARLRGSGMVNGDRSPTGLPYQFMLWARDDRPDALCMRIWWESPAGEITVFDNGDSELARGSIVIHQARH